MQLGEQPLEKRFVVGRTKRRGARNGGRGREEPPGGEGFHRGRGSLGGDQGTRDRSGEIVEPARQQAHPGPKPGAPLGDDTRRHTRRPEHPHPVDALELEPPPAEAHPHLLHERGGAVAERRVLGPLQESAHQEEPGGAPARRRGHRGVPCPGEPHRTVVKPHAADFRPDEADNAFAIVDRNGRLNLGIGPRLLYQRSPEEVRHSGLRARRADRERSSNEGGNGGQIPWFQGPYQRPSRRGSSFRSSASCVVGRRYRGGRLPQGAGGRHVQLTEKERSTCSEVGAAAAVAGLPFPLG